MEEKEEEMLRKKRGSERVEELLEGFKGEIERVGITRDLDREVLEKHKEEVELRDKELRDRYKRSIGVDIKEKEQVDMHMKAMYGEVYTGDLTWLGLVKLRKIVGWERDDLLVDYSEYIKLADKRDLLAELGSRELRYTSFSRSNIPLYMPEYLDIYRVAEGYTYVVIEGRYVLSRYVEYKYNKYMVQDKLDYACYVAGKALGKHAMDVSKVERYSVLYRIRGREEQARGEEIRVDLGMLPKLEREDIQEVDEVLESKYVELYEYIKGREGVECCLKDKNTLVFRIRDDLDKYEELLNMGDILDTREELGIRAYNIYGEGRTLKELKDLLYVTTCTGEEGVKDYKDIKNIKNGGNIDDITG